MNVLLLSSPLTPSSCSQLTAYPYPLIHRQTNSPNSSKMYECDRRFILPEYIIPNRRYLMHNLFTMNLGNAMDDNFALAFGRINF